MKNCLFAVLMSSFCMAISCADANTRVEKNHKIYIDPQAIHIMKDGFIVQTIKGPIKVRKVWSDQKGFFVRKFQTKFGYESDEERRRIYEEAREVVREHRRERDRRERGGFKICSHEQYMK